MQQGYRSSGQRERSPQRDERRALPQVARTEALALVGSSSVPATITERLEQAAAIAHVVSPAMSVAMLPVGFAVNTSIVQIDIATETYEVDGGRIALSKSALDRIAAAAGISWDPVRSGRTDDGRHPYYCSWQAVGTMRHLDGSVVTLIGSYQMDLRDGSEHARKSEKQLGQMRLHIMGHAETKARLRAVRSIGLRSSYLPAELAKPFVAARVVFTGESDDPEIRRVFAEKMADSFLNGHSALYGGTPTPRSLPREATPPVGEFVDADLGDDEFTQGAPHREPMRTERTPQRAQPARDELPRPSPQPARRRGTGLTIPFGRSKGTPIEDATDDDLIYLRDHIAGKFEAGDVNPRFEAENRRLLEGVKAELAARDEGDDR